MTARLFFLISALAFALTARAASTISFKDITSTNAVKTNDLLLVDSDLGGGNYATRTAVLTLALDKLTRKQATNALAASGSLTDVLLGNGNWGVLAFDNLTNSAAAPNDTTKFWNGKGLWSTPLSGGNVTNSGASVAGMFPTYTDTSGTQVTPTNGIPLLNVGTLTFTGGAANIVPVFDGSTNLVPSRTSTNSLDTIRNLTTDALTQFTNKVDLTVTTDQSMSGRLLTPSLTVGAMAISRGTLTHAGGNVIVDFAATNRYWSCTITGNVTFVLTNAVAGKWANLLLFNPSANATPTFNFPASSITNWFGGAPSSLTANTVGALSYYCISTDTNAVKAAYAETQ